MKNYLIIFLFLAFGCGTSKVEKLIADYEQASVNSGIDLNFRPVRIIMVGKLKASDLAAQYQEHYDSTLNVFYENRRLAQLENLRNLREAKRKYEEAPPHEKSGYARNINSYTQMIEMNDNRVKSIKEDPDSYFHDEWVAEKKNYESMGDEVVSYVYKCTYIIRDTVFDVDRQFTDWYSITPDLKKVLWKTD